MTKKGIWECKSELQDFLAETDAWNKEFSEKNIKEIREKFPEDKYIIVQHETTKKWEEKFKEQGIDCTIPPPEMRYGRLTTKKGFPYGYQEPICTTGLYVQPPKQYESGVVIAIKPHELAISQESAQGSCKTPECALYYYRDAIVKDIIPPERVLGSFNWQPKPREQWESDIHYSHNYEWKFNPNEKALKNKEMKELVECIEYKDGNLEWCGCNNDKNTD